LEVVKILEAASESLKQQGASVNLGGMPPWNNGHQNGHVNGHANAKGKAAANVHSAPVIPAVGRTAVAA
jgi:hypothetical protein